MLQFIIDLIKSFKFNKPFTKGWLLQFYQVKKEFREKKNNVEHYLRELFFLKELALCVIIM